MERITERYADKIAGILECYDRIIIQGTLPGLCHADGMTGYLLCLFYFRFGLFMSSSAVSVKRKSVEYARE